MILSQDEAWDLMTVGGDTLKACGFEVRVPQLKRKKATASLRLTSEADETVVGAQQLADVRWSAVFDDVELTAAEIAQLAREARPLVKSRGTWVEIDKNDLAEAAAALAERADQTRLTGADMLRHALGLEGSPLSGGVNIVGGGWAADLLRSVESLPEEPTTTPEGFTGELRSYQADALAWLAFLDDAGLGGCLALDMGLGKTPTTLASIALSSRAGTALVIAPPAVVGNWASEARKFVPGVNVLVHHGGNRAKGPALGSAVRGADLVITTYGTAVRDMDQLSEFEWGKVVIDEAQAIKNPPPRSPSSSAVSRLARGWRSPAPRSRTASATCGRSWTGRIRACSVPGHRSSPSSHRQRRARRVATANALVPSMASSCTAEPRLSRRSRKNSPIASTSSTTVR